MLIHMKLNRKGISLIEVMIMMTITAIMMMASGIVTFRSIQNWQDSHTIITVHDDMVNGLRQMVREIREAGAASPSGIIVSGPGSDTINFEIPATMNESGPLTWETISYTLGGDDGKQLIRTDNSGSRTFSTNMADLTFDYDPAVPKVVGIALVGERESQNGRLITRQLSSQVTVRN